jgi:hypothetical protein
MSPIYLDTRSSTGYYFHSYGLLLLVPAIGISSEGHVLYGATTLACCRLSPPTCADNTHVSSRSARIESWALTYLSNSLGRRSQTCILKWLLYGSLGGKILPHPCTCSKVECLDPVNSGEERKTTRGSIINCSLCLFQLYKGHVLRYSVNARVRTSNNSHRSITECCTMRLADNVYMHCFARTKTFFLKNRRFPSKRSSNTCDRRLCICEEFDLGCLFACIINNKKRYLWLSECARKLLYLIYSHVF